MPFILRLALACLVLHVAIAVTAQTDSIRWVTVAKADSLREAGSTRPFYVYLQTEWCTFCREEERTTFCDSELVAYVNAHFTAVWFNSEDTARVRFNGKVYQRRFCDGFLLNEFAYDISHKNVHFPGNVYLLPDGAYFASSGGYQSAYQLLTCLSYLAEAHYRTQTFDTYRDTYRPPSWRGKRGGVSGTMRRTNPQK